MIDQLAKAAPDTVFASIPRTSDPNDGFEDVTYARLANAVNRTAQWLQNSTELPSQSRTTVAYLGTSDIRYIALILAAQKLGCVMFLPSPHNPAEVQKDLLHATHTQLLLCSEESATQARDLVKPSGVQLAVVPTLAELFDASPVEHVLYKKTHQQEKNRPFVVLHTSGTTGTPKPVVLPHAYYAYEDLSQGEEYAGCITSVPFTAGVRCLTTAPMWHAGGMFFSLLKPILNQIVTVLPPTGLPITAELVDTCLNLLDKIDILQAAPSLLADMSADARYELTLENLTYIVMGSGPMAKDAGDRLLGINAETLHFFGATRTDLLPLLPLKDPVDWQYHRFHPLSGATFRKISKGMHELVVEKVPNAVQPYFDSNPKAKEYSTKDVFSPHPKEPDLWKFDCRLDDILTFSTGEKINPTAFEAAVRSPGCFVLVVGQGRTRPALLVWMVKNPVSGLLDTMWPRIEAANALLPTYGRIDRDMVTLVGFPDVTPKGTINRRKTELKWSNMVNDLYAAKALFTLDDDIASGVDAWRGAGVHSGFAY